MEFKKNALSYCLWFLNSAFVLIGACFYGIKYHEYFGMSFNVGAIGCPLLVLLVGAIALGARKIFREKSEYYEDTNNTLYYKIQTSDIVPITLFILLIGGLFAIRYNDLSHVVSNPLLEASFVSSNYKLPELAQIVQVIYVSCMHFFMWLLGNNIAVAYFVCVFFELSSYVFLFFFIKNIDNSKTAIITMALLMILSPLKTMTRTASVDCILLFVISFGLFLSSLAIRNFNNRIILALLSVLSGLLVFVDLSAIIVPVVIVFGICFRDSNEYTSERIVNSIIAIIGCGVGFLLSILIYSLINKISFGEVFLFWTKEFMFKDAVVLYALDLFFSEFEILFIFMIFGIGFYSFWFDSTFDVRYIFYLIFDVLAMLYICGLHLSYSNTMNLLFVFGAVIISSGISDIFKFVQVEEKKPQYEDYSVKNVGYDYIPDNPQAAKNIDFIKNPLPVPKKHVKKEIDFDVDVSPDDDFDIDISPDDDYDI